jgi:UDP-N-acetylmuramate dehydrogenase
LVAAATSSGVIAVTPGETERYVTAGGGVAWDEFVAYTADRDMTGVEFLSLIPGTVGATPVQNVGAYGQEVGNSIVTIEAYDKQTHQFVTIPGSECNFSYRNSRFKGADKGRFFITAVTFFLNVGNPTPPFYGAVEQYCKDHNITQLTPKIGRDAVIAIRSTKLPDPAVIANNGSFFGNPIISTDKYFELHNDYPEIAHWPVDDQHVKLSAAWLIDNAGFKDVHDAETGMATWHTQPLVLVNEHATSTANLLAFKQKIVDTVQAKFGITLEQEPELIG